MAGPSPSPRVLATASLPSVINYSSDEDPELRLTLTLLDVSHPITWLYHHSSLWPLVNALVIHNTRTGQEHALPTMDVCWRRPDPLRLTRSQEAKFLTLRPGQPHMISYNFRPFGHESDREKIGIMKGSKYAILVLGMHLLDIGEQYSLRVKEGLRIGSWAVGDKEDLIVDEDDQGGQWRSVGDPIDIVAGEEVTFRVEA